MKRLLYTLRYGWPLPALMALIMPFAFVSCGTLPTPSKEAIVDIGVTYGVAKYLAGAKTVEQFVSRQQDLGDLAVVLKTINNGSANPVALRALITSRFGTKPEVLLLANIVLTYLQPNGPNSEPRNELVARAIVALEASAAQAAPAF